jgi:hypothetical protein
MVGEQGVEVVGLSRVEGGEGVIVHRTVDLLSLLKLRIIPGVMVTHI